MNRFELLSEWVEGKSVLDIGCVGAVSDEITGKEIGGENWLHKHIVRSASETIGIDTNTKGIQIAQQKGYEVKEISIRNYEPNAKFDAVVAGELIEHLPNFGYLFKKSSKLLKKGGVLILTTPNPYSLYHIFQRGLKGKFLQQYKEHVAWHDPMTLSNVANIYSMDLETVVFLPYPYQGSPNPAKSKVQDILYKLSSTIQNPQLGSNTFAAKFRL